MKVTDGRLVELAAKAGVRPPHIWFMFCYAKAFKGAFSAEGFAAFSQLELRHVDRMLAVFASEGLMPSPPSDATSLAKGADRGSRIPTDICLAPEWEAFAQRETGWPQAEIHKEWEAFCDHWRAAPGARGMKLDWLATWRNWIRNSRKPKAPIGQGALENWGEDQRAQYLKRLSQ